MTSIEAVNLFNVDGLVTVITGGGTSRFSFQRERLTSQVQSLVDTSRHRSHDGKGSRTQQSKGIHYWAEGGSP